MKKTMAMLLALVMLFALCVPAMAVTAGTITVSNATVGHTYSLYRLLDLASYQDANPDNPADGIYAYKINEKWAGFFAQDSTKAYIETDANGVITWKTGADAAAFAQAALAYANTNHITADASDEAEGATVVFTGMDLGYYLLDSTLGALCSLDTTNPNVEIADKNYLPTLTKKVGNDLDETTASIGDTVDFKLTIVVGVGYSSYTLTDNLPDGLTLDASTIEVALNDGKLTEGTDYTLTTTGLTGADFQIVFEKAFLDNRANNDEITVTYSALVNANAAAANTNSATLKTDNDLVKSDSATVYTYKFDLVKTDSNGVLLNGAEFELYDAQTAGNKIGLIKVDGGYRPVTGTETPETIVVTGGKVTIFGLKAGTYYLEETVAPTGYNMLTGRVKVELNSDLTATGDQGGVRVTNYTGSELPSTGGIGTTVFYAMGGLLMAAAVVLLVTRKKTESNK